MYSPRRIFLPSHGKSTSPSLSKCAVVRRVPWCRGQSGTIFPMLGDDFPYVGMDQNPSLRRLTENYFSVCQETFNDFNDLLSHIRHADIDKTFSNP
jgi:hypothetical protein